MGESVYQQCMNCVMDTTAPKITFDNSGICEYCNNYYDKILPSGKIFRIIMYSVIAT